MTVRFTVTNRSGSMIRQLTLNVCCWLAEVRLAGPQVRYEREADVRSYPTLNEELLLRQRIDLQGAGHSD